jgi:hypothetical protein
MRAHNVYSRRLTLSLYRRLRRWGFDPFHARLAVSGALTAIELV